MTGGDFRELVSGITQKEKETKRLVRYNLDYHDLKIKDWDSFRDLN